MFVSWPVQFTFMSVVMGPLMGRLDFWQRVMYGGLEWSGLSEPFLILDKILCGTQLIWTCFTILYLILFRQSLSKFNRFSRSTLLILTYVLHVSENNCPRCNYIACVQFKLNLFFGWIGKLIWWWKPGQLFYHCVIVILMKIYQFTGLMIEGQSTKCRWQKYG